MIEKKIFRPSKRCVIKSLQKAIEKSNKFKNVLQTCHFNFKFLINTANNKLILIFSYSWTELQNKTIYRIWAKYFPNFPKYFILKNVLFEKKNDQMF